MEKRTERILLFFLGCVTVRVGLVVAAVFLPTLGQKILAGVLFFLAAGLIYRFVTFFTSDYEQKTATGSEVWFNPLRLVHAILYILFGILVFMGVKKAWFLLVLDVLIAVFAFSFRYFIMT